MRKAVAWLEQQNDALGNELANAVDALCSGRAAPITKGALLPRVAAIVAECATQEEIDAEYDKLTEQIKEGRPAAGGLFWRRLCGLVCLCNCAICLLAVLYSPTVLMVVCYLWGCIPAKTDDVVAIPKVYIEWAVAVATLMNKRYPGRVGAGDPVRVPVEQNRAKLPGTRAEHLIDFLLIFIIFIVIF